jgi:alcohol dehydrogenase (cytochrome c)
VSPAQRAVSPDDWPGYNRTFAGDRFSPLSDITTENVARLRPVCTFETGEQVSFQTGPVVVNGIMYLTSDRGTFAIDAATCAVKWKQPLPFPPSSLQVNRGVAYDNGRVFRGAGPGHVIALNAATGATAWDIVLNPFVPGMTVPMAPVAWNGMVFVGNAGGDNYGVTGHVWALDQKDGHTIWRFDVVPESGPARNSWRNAAGIPITGGAFWTTFALDPQAGILVVPAGNPAPDFQPDARPGRQPVFEFSDRHRCHSGQARRLRAARQGRQPRLGRGCRTGSGDDAGRAPDHCLRQQRRFALGDRAVTDETPVADTDDHA